MAADLHWLEDVTCLVPDVRQHGDLSRYVIMVFFELLDLLVVRIGPSSSVESIFLLLGLLLIRVLFSPSLFAFVPVCDIVWLLSYFSHDGVEIYFFCFLAFKLLSDLSIIDMQ